MIENFLQKKAFARNLASYTTTKMDEKFLRIICASLLFNLANRSIYKELYEVERYCVENIASMFKADNLDTIDGKSTLGSSEAILIFLLVLKSTFSEVSKPNIIISQHAHFSWNFAASMLGFIVKTVNVDINSFNINQEHLSTLLDRNTLAVVVTAGTTLTGIIEDVQLTLESIIQFNKIHDCNIYIHIDAAIGGFVLPFLFESHLYGLNLDNVNSLNVSSHKYGGVYPSCGWFIFKKQKFKYQHEIISFDYLFNSMNHLNINFSMPAAFVICQYEIFNNEEKDYYSKKISNYFDVMLYVQNMLKSFGIKIINDTKIKAPVIVFDINDENFREQFSDSMIKNGGWYIPFYTIKSTNHNKKYHRIVIKDNICDEETIKSFKNDFSKVVSNFYRSTKNTISA